jgi:hypothetical protein
VNRALARLRSRDMLLARMSAFKAMDSVPVMPVTRLVPQRT